MAAGGAERFGQAKLLMPWRKSTVLNAVIETGILVGLEPLIVVLGANVKALIEQLPCFEKLRVATNDEWRTGQSSSIRCGLSALQEPVEGAVFLLGDQPQITPVLIDAVVTTGMRDETICLPYINERRANPVYFPSKYFRELQSITGDVGGRSLFTKYPVKLIDWYDDPMGWDMDTRQDYDHLGKEFGAI